MVVSVKRPIRDLSRDELAEWLSMHGQPAFRLRQIQDWLYSKWVADFKQMRNLPKTLVAELEASFVCSAVCEQRTETAEDETIKWLLELQDGETLETVLIKAPDRYTVCISTQVGCSVRCSFCASGRDGLIRDLSPGEIIDQILHACRVLGRKITHVVVMGMGEPLLNMDNLIRALDTICSADRFGLGARHVTVSTSGIVPGIVALADVGPQWNLALSLHSPTDEGRRALIPDAYRYPLAEILDACVYYREKTGRKVTFEYTLIAEKNDSDRELAQLAQLARRLNTKINLIPCNQTRGPHTRPGRDIVEHWITDLSDQGIQVTVRREKGSEIQAACGQLRRRATRQS